MLSYIYKRFNPILLNDNDNYYIDTLKYNPTELFHGDGGWSLNLLLKTPLIYNIKTFLINTFSRGTPGEGKGGEKKLVMTGYRGC